MTGPADLRRPHRAAARVVELAALVLPRGDIRRRYERELVAELYGLGGRDQARHVLGVLISIWSLRAAVTAENYTQLEESMGHVSHRRPLLCRLNLRHHWQTGHTEDGGRYTYCSRCDKVRVKGRIPPGIGISG
jgi:hypothetical protein